MFFFNKGSLCCTFSRLVQSKENVVKPHSRFVAKALWRCGDFQTRFSVLPPSQQKNRLLWNEHKLTNNRFALLHCLLWSCRSNPLAIRSLMLKITSYHPWEMNCSPDLHSWIPLFSWVKLCSLAVMCHNLMPAV